MSNSINHAQDGEPADGTSAPRAVVHKKILEAAEERPDASFPELADAVSGASEELVERVLEEYGDPAKGEDESSNQSEAAADDAATPPMRPDETMNSQNTGSNDDADLDLERVTERQERVLRAIYERPNATQAELADDFDVTAATISQRVNAIDEFDWSRRREIVDSLFDDSEFEGVPEPESAGSESETDPPQPRSESSTGPDAAEPGADAPGPAPDVAGPDSPAPEAEADTADSAPDATEPGTDSSGSESDGTGSESVAPDPESTSSEARVNGVTTVEAIEELTEQVDDLIERVVALEGRIEEQSADEGALSEPDLVSKMVHACMESERVTEDEELRILRSVLTTVEAVDS